MGECDRYKNYISDYLDNSLDPSTHKEFEKALKNSSDLQKMTNRVARLRSSLKNLSYQTCSDDFSLRLRERIHTESEPVISRQNLVRLSFAFSLIVIVVFATFSLTNFSDSTDSDIPVQEAFDLQKNTPPSSNPASSTNNPIIKDRGVEVKTKYSQDALEDSIRAIPKRNPDSRTHRVDQEK